MKQSVALFFGSFNPVHAGHIAIANHILHAELSHEVWFVLSPMNPLKQNISQATDRHRLRMLELAIGQQPHFSVCDIELGMPLPSYTINTMSLLSSTYPETAFSIIIGMDNLQLFKQWKSWKTLLVRYQMLVYPRTLNQQQSELFHRHIFIMNEAPLIDISSTEIRQMIQSENPYRHLLPEGVAEYIEEHNLYRQSDH